MGITIQLSPEDEARLRERATSSGDGLEDYLRRVVEQHLKAPDRLSTLLAPLRREFAESGLSEDDLDALVEEARQEVWLERQGQTPGSS